jgi:diguanylate cyclase (GGDEF)-like protein
MKSKNMGESPLVTVDEIYVGKGSADFHKKDKGRIKDSDVANTAAYAVKGILDRHEQHKKRTPAEEKREYARQITEFSLLETAEGLKKDEIIREKEKLSLMDPFLKELHNKSYFPDRLASELAGDRRGSPPTGVIIGDLEDLKGINDRYGHKIGDAVLKAMEQGIANGFRGIDVKCRTGGDETAIILPDEESDAGMDLSPLGSAVSAALRVAKEIHSMQVANGENDGLFIAPIVDFGVTISNPYDDVESITDRADKASYIAKHLHKTSGRLVSVVSAHQEGYGSTIRYEEAHYDEDGEIVSRLITDAEAILAERKNKN